MTGYTYSLEVTSYNKQEPLLWIGLAQERMQKLHLGLALSCHPVESDKQREQNEEKAKTIVTGQRKTRMTTLKNLGGNLTQYR